MKFRRALCLATAVAIAGCATPITPVMPKHRNSRLMRVASACRTCFQ